MIVDGILCAECDAAFIPGDDGCACQYSDAGYKEVMINTGPDGRDRMVVEARVQTATGAGWK